jgi:hypothetical protein
MTEERLTFEQIKQRYSEEWVMLVDYDWPVGEPWPKSGVVWVHSPNRREYWRLANEKKPRPKDTAGFFVGPPHPEDGIVRNNLMTVTLCEK